MAAKKKRVEAAQTPATGEVFSLAEMTTLRLGVLGAALDASIFAMLWAWDDMATVPPLPEGLDRAAAIEREVARREIRRRAIERVRNACTSMLDVLEGFHPGLE